MAQRSTAKALSDILKEWIPALERDAEDYGRQTVQTSIWLVGLATALLTTLGIKSSTLTPLLPGTRVATIVCLVAVVVLGVAQRLLYQLSETRRRGIIKGLQGYLVGFSADHDPPSEPAHGWTRSDVIDQFQRGFDIDFGFLETHNVPDDECLKIYRDQYDAWKEHDDTSLAKIKSLFGAYYGVSNGNDSQGIDEAAIRRVASSAHQLAKASEIVYWAAGISFVAAIILLAIAVGAKALAEGG